MTAREISNILRSLANPAIAAHSRRFFKTGIGQYGEGDRFLGIRVPELRGQAKKYMAVPLAEVQRLLSSAYHEERLCALLILVQKFSKGGPTDRKAIYKVYLKNTRYINNWDLVDLSAPFIVGAYLVDKDRRLLYKMARSKSLWERRIAVLATFNFIKNLEFIDALKIVGMLVDDREDLIHKAAGWMLREVGKREPNVEKAFLKQHYRRMPRTMLRYAIEKFPEHERRQYLKGAV